MDIKTIRGETTEFPRMDVVMIVTNEGEDVGRPWGKLKLEAGEEIIGRKEQQMRVNPHSQTVLSATFDFVDYDQETTYTISGTIPGHDWVTPEEVHHE